VVHKALVVPLLMQALFFAVMILKFVAKIRTIRMLFVVPTLRIAAMVPVVQAQNYAMIKCPPQLVKHLLIHK
jgi:hypothetical protein